MGAHWDDFFEGLVESCLTCDTWYEIPCTWSPVPMRQQHVWKLANRFRCGSDQGRLQLSHSAQFYCLEVFLVTALLSSYSFMQFIWQFIFLYIKTGLFHIFQTKPHLWKWNSCLVVFHRRSVPLSSTSHRAEHGTNTGEKGWWMGDAGLRVLGFNICFLRGKVWWPWSLNDANVGCPR